MKTKLILSFALALGLATVAAHAQQQRIATIDLRKAFDGYWRTKQADTNLKEQAADLEKDRNAMVQAYQKTQESYKKIIESANDPAVSNEERDKRKKSAETELLNLRKQEDAIKQFDATSRTTLGEKQRRVREQILTEVKDKIRAKAKAGSYTMVIDTAAETVNNTPVVLYTANAEHDLTDTVLEELNLNAPKETARPAETKPAGTK